VPFVILMGTGALAGGLAFWIVGALAAPLTWLIGRDAGFDKRPAFAAALMVAVPGGLTPFLSQPDNFGLFMTLGALALWLCAQGARGDRRAFVLGGLVVGLATLARSDGVLLGLPFAIVGVRELVRRARGIEVNLSVAAVIGSAALFAIVMVPWLYRQLEVFGSLFPSASSGRILWISDYSELYSITSPTGLSILLADGLGSFLAGRIGSSGPHVTIGAEHEDPALSDFTVITSEYHAGNLRGVIGVIGPTRMPYDRVITLVESTSAHVSDFLTGFTA